MERRTRGFTLLELILAVTILAVVIGAIYSALRTGMRAYYRGEKLGRIQQIGTVALKDISKELRSIYVPYETEYYYPEIDYEEGEYPEEVEEDLEGGTFIFRYLFKYYLRGTCDEITFTATEPVLGSEDPRAKELVQLHYYVDDGVLYKSRRNVLQPEEEFSAYDEEENADILAEFVEELSFEYGFTEYGEWIWKEDWDSLAYQYRLQPTEDDFLEYEDLIDNEEDEDGDVYEFYPFMDGLPNGVRVMLVLKDESLSPAPHTYKSFVRLPVSVVAEPYIDEEEEDW